MVISRKSSLKNVLIYKGLVYSAVVYFLGVIVLVTAAYFMLSSDFDKINRATLYQTSMAVLPDLQDGNYYGVKHTLDQLVKAETFKSIVVIGFNGKVFAKNGNWDPNVLNNIVNTVDVSTGIEPHMMRVGSDRIIVREVYDQNGITWGKLVGIVNDAKYFTLLRNIALLLLLIMCLVVAAHVLVSCVVVRKSIQPLIRFTGDIDKIATRIANVGVSDKGGEIHPSIVHECVASLRYHTGTGCEIDDLLKTFSKLLQKIGQFWSAYLDSSNLIAIGQSTAMVAHDVRKPLASMKALLTSLPFIKDDQEQLRQMIAGVDRNISNTNAILDDILDFSRDSTALSLDDCDPQSLIVSALSDALRNHAGSDVRIEYHLNHKHAVRADCVRVVRVLTNLVDNALDAMTEDGQRARGSLVLTTYEVERDGQAFEAMSVADEGSGIPADVIGKIFDPFFTHGKKGGTGLGLAICQRVISLHGGRIEARNREGSHGAVFSVELPRGEKRVWVNDSELIHHADELKAFREEEAARVDYGDTANTAEFMRINKERGRASYLLIMDDEPLFRESIRSILSELSQVKDHVKVVEAESAETALKLFEARKFDYVIADIDLGKRKMNGYEFTQLVLDTYPNTHVLINSNKRRSELDANVREISNHKFMGFLPKPMRASELLQFLACKTFEAPAACGTEQKPKRKVLVVNDDEFMRVALRMSLQRAGSVQVVEAESVSDALRVLESHAADVILSDINLGEREMSGYELLRRVKGQKSEAKFYMMSGMQRDDEWPKAEKLGADGYIQLPYEEEELKKLIM